MKLEQIGARIAPRNAWQALDLGVHAWRSWWRPLTAIWVAVTLVPFCLIIWFSYPDNLILGMLLFWWLKPLWEKPLLAYCARALFEPGVSARTAVLDDWRRMMRHLPAQLLWRRLDPSRCVHMPVAQLEGLGGEEYSRRVRALGMGGNTHGATLTIGLLHIEQGFSYGLTVLLMMLWPNQMHLDQVDWFLDASSPWFLASLGCWYLAMTVTQPLYVASGFTAYLNRRTWLEAWDLQIGLRRIGRERQLVSPRAMALLACLLIPMVWPDNARATESGAPPRQEAIEILAGEEFSPMEIRDGWRLRDLGNDDQQEQEDDTQWWVKFLTWLFSSDGQSDSASLPDWLRHIDSPAEVLRLLLWCLVISLVLWLVWRFRHLMVHWLPDAPVAHRRPTALAGMDIRRQSLPADIRASALAALADGHVREALALLYRGTLSRLMERHQLALPPGSTESECLAAFREAAQGDTGVTLLSRLTPLWVATAWAHRPPEHEIVEELARNWGDTFQSESGQ